MVKKVILSFALVGFIGILVVGAVLRTQNKTDQVSESQDGQGRGRSAQTTPVNEDEHVSTRQQRGQGNRDQTNEPGASPGTDEAAVEAWVTREGTVIALDEEMLTILLDDGETLVVEGRAWSFSQEQSLAVAIGDHLGLTGFYEGNTFEVGQIDDITTNQTVVLREGSGRPLWSGRGRRDA